ncbi:MAG: VOC family protein [Alcanivorax sp.]|uniref:VOC family protein n=1 Tax=Alcanivorax sp. TaxID=1872427 RepID=UPI003DA6FA62
MEPRISMITLGVRDLTTAIRFYEQGLGLPRRPMPDDAPVAFFELNGTWLGLFGHDDLADDAGVAPSGEGFRGVAMAHNVESPQQVDQLLAQAQEAGAQLIKPGQPTDWGGYAGYFADPDRHLWEVACNPHFWVGPR